MNNLNNLSDDQLDKLFRQSAEESDFEFDEGAWQKMNSLLNKKQPLQTNWRKFSIILLAIFFLGGSSLYFGNEKGLFTSSKNDSKTINGSQDVIGNNQLGSENTKLNLVETNKNDINTEISKSNNFEKRNLGASANISDKKSEKSETKNSKLNNLEENKISSKAKISENKVAPNNKTEFANINKKFESKNVAKPQNNKIARNDNMNNSKNSIVPPKQELATKIPTEKDKPESTKPTQAENTATIGENNTETFAAIEKKNNLNSKNKSTNWKPTNSKIENIKSGRNNNNQEITVIEKPINLNSENIKGENFLQNEANEKKGHLPFSKFSLQKVVNSLESKPKKNQTESLNEAVEMPIEKTYLQNIFLKYLLAKTDYKYIKSTFKVEVSSLDLKIPEPKKVDFFKKGFAIRLAISPDISTISGNKISKIGSNMGGLLEYRLNKKLSVQAGVFRSMKYYDAQPNQYTWVWGYSHDKLVSIAATCKMIDYPINIRYDILAKGPTRVFVGAGTTTYKMLNEYYFYNYADNTSPTIKHKDWSGKTGTYYSSNLNLSIGLEKYLSKNFIIQVEPFAKSPLKSIGFGKVPLVTYGMMISGKFPFSNLSKK